MQDGTIKTMYAALAVFQIDLVGTGSKNPQVEENLRQAEAHITEAMRHVLAAMTPSKEPNREEL